MSYIEYGSSFKLRGWIGFPTLSISLYTCEYLREGFRVQRICGENTHWNLFPALKYYFLSEVFPFPVNVISESQCYLRTTKTKKIFQYHSDFTLLAFNKKSNNQNGLDIIFHFNFLSSLLYIS